MQITRFKTKLLVAAAIIAAAAIAFITLFNPASLVASQQQKNDEFIAEQMAYHIGCLAYLYGTALQLPPLQGQSSRREHGVFRARIFSTSHQ